METFGLIGVWAYLVAATVAEVIVFYAFPASTLVNTSIGVLAASKAVLIVLYFMHLKYEPRSIQILIIPPAFLVVVLVLTMVFSLPH
ncbi:MAG: cytochrome C oxidase subunit IV family protein [Thaumarchaeota archaeon]|nr:cytochrome C oxidase subunit IV family protein [Nitrososphaerota archaeon]MBI3023075.1 cytochrome C oxidase subunit IV family protein [Nitrososphaerota archaeon]MBI3115877.1 cytochrome C oxidase subunit IV family protein [Nitrososphaerota archaeon]MCS4539636.1 cytochrome C oxidase subunit IV family protein [Nitrososphaerota archaeon]